ncbi:MAG TPA: LysR family transcriptional regulator [Steroidobacteraceae bacterium]
MTSGDGPVMELRHLRYFVALADELHFGRAAERIGIEQSPFSRAIRELEVDLGVRLFIRTSRRTQITRAGERLLIEARRILKAVNGARKATQAVAAGVKHKLRIGVSASIAQPRVARLLARCCADQPDVEFEICDRSQRRQAAQIREGLLDIGLAPSPSRADGLQSEVLWTSTLALLLPANHRMAGVGAIPIKCLKSEPRVLSHPELRHIFEDKSNFPLDTGASRPVRYQAVPGMSMLQEMVGAGTAVGVVLAAQAEALRRLDVVARPLGDPSLQIAIHVISRIGQPSENVNRFLHRARGIP